MGRWQAAGHCAKRLSVGHAARRQGSGLGTHESVALWQTESHVFELKPLRHLDRETSQGVGAGFKQGVAAEVEQPAEFAFATAGKRREATGNGTDHDKGKEGRPNPEVHRC